MKNKAFTLAEVLITLSIIGVVAALTIPSLVVKNQEKQTVVQLKKAYNVFSNAFSLAKIEYGEPNSWGWTNGGQPGSINALNKLAPFLNILQRCNEGKGCFAKNVNYKNMAGGNIGIVDSWTHAKARLTDGTSFVIISDSANCIAQAGNTEALKQVCGNLQIDINGDKSPNQLGKDYFTFRISNLGIIPAGTPDDVAKISADCVGGAGYACTAWVLLKENMNYPPQGTDWDGTVVSP